MERERAVARKKESEAKSLTFWSIIGVGALIGVGFGVYKTGFASMGWFRNQSREKQPWEREPT